MEPWREITRFAWSITNIQPQKWYNVCVIQVSLGFLGVSFGFPGVPWD